ncbi:DNA-processing protein DprA [Massilia sp. TSP1-1-2]|uniref:DNA-processing protein DprA n=1 Tax=Massilia sp. TSP1-1-2 TaxID=2804649 RepID=UPI003CF26CC4
MQDTDPAPPLDQAASLAAWIRLELTPGVGRVTVHCLLERLRTPQAIFSAGYHVLAGLVSPARARVLSEPPSQLVAQRIDAALTWLDAPGRHLLTPDDAAYPGLLRHIPDPPFLLYAIGRTELLAGPAVAMVGSRNASVQGLSNAGNFGHALSEAGLTIVSGMALGIDAAAHEGGLRGVGSTVAVIGTGADRIYPRRNERLARRIAEEGCIISEYSLGTPPASANFPRRNRIISGLSCAVLVVEAAAGSGSLITARMALEQGRDVFAIPGSIHSALAKGCHKLIKEGAKLVESVGDLLTELCLSPMAEPSAETAPGYCGAAHALLEAMGQGPVNTDALAALTQTAPAFLAGQLLTLELAGHIERLPGGLFQRINR